MVALTQAHPPRHCHLLAPSDTLTHALRRCRCRRRRCCQVELLLDISDEGIGERLKKFELEQAQGEKLNELTEKYYTRHPRAMDDPWPLPQHKETDSVLRKFLTSWTEIKPSEIVKLAKSELNIEID